MGGHFKTWMLINIFCDDEFYIFRFQSIKLPPKLCGKYYQELKHIQITKKGGYTK